MTARKAGELAADGVFGTLRRLRDQWVLLVFAASVLFWARDVYEEFVDLPARVAALSGEVGELRSGVERLVAGQVAAAAKGAPARDLPGTKHAIEHGRPGEVVMVSVVPAPWEQGNCAIGITAVMIDAGGKWYQAEARLVERPEDEVLKELAFGVKIHPRMDVGRAELLVQLARKCGPDRQETSLRLPFHVLPR